MKSWLRMHIYAINTAFRRLLAMPFSSITNITVIAFVLALPLMAAAVISSLTPIAQHIAVNPAITLFMKNTTPLQEAEQLSHRMKSDFPNDIQNIHVISKQEAFNTLKMSDEWADSLTALSNNPLPHSIIVVLDNDTTTDRAKELAHVWGSNALVDIVQFDSDWGKKLEDILYFLKVVLSVLALCVAIVVVTTVFNTVRMQALVQRDEISVARLVGATESFVRRPFLYFGTITGLCAGLFSVGLSVIALHFMNSTISVLSENYGQSFALSLPKTLWLFLAIISVMIVAALAATWSVTRHSRF